MVETLVAMQPVLKKMGQSMAEAHKTVEKIVARVVKSQEAELKGKLAWGQSTINAPDQIDVTSFGSASKQYIPLSGTTRITTDWNEGMRINGYSQPKFVFHGGRTYMLLPDGKHAVDLTDAAFLDFQLRQDFPSGTNVEADIRMVGSMTIVDYQAVTGPDPGVAATGNTPAGRKLVRKNPSVLDGRESETP